MISVPRVHFLCSGKETSKIRLDDDDDHIRSSPFETCENNNTLLCLSFSLLYLHFSLQIFLFFFLSFYIFWRRER